MGDICKKAFVTGRVQGVWFRGSTQDQARRLGVVGWAKNLPDGRVEVLMCGSQKSVATLEQWLHKGPPLARVKSVATKEVPMQHFDTFVTG